MAQLILAQAFLNFLRCKGYTVNQDEGLTWCDAVDRLMSALTEDSCRRLGTEEFLPETGLSEGEVAGRLQALLDPSAEENTTSTIVRADPMMRLQVLLESFAHMPKSELPGRLAILLGEFDSFARTLLSTGATSANVPP